MSITSEDLLKVYTATFEARNKWRNIFLVLGMSPASINALGTKWKDDPDDCYREGLLEWLRRGQRTWQELIEALSSPIVGQNDIANEIAKDLAQSVAQGGSDAAVSELIVTLPNPYTQVINENLTIFSNENIGTGAFGAVFRGSYRGSVCAVKVLHHTAKQIQENLLTTQVPETTVEAFKRECEFIRSFQHPNIVHYLSTDRHPKSSNVILVTELLDCNLRSYFSDLSEESFTRICQLSLSKDVALGLAYIHSKMVVHRDLCGDNILLKLAQPLPIAKISDFGMSRLIDSTQFSSTLSAVGHRMGYIPPEALREEDELYDHSLDVFSLGVVMVQIARKLATVKSVKDRKFHLDQIPVTHPLKSLINDCIQVDKSKRPSAGDVCAKLEIKLDLDSMDTTEVDMVSAQNSTVSLDPLQAVMVGREATADLQVMTSSNRLFTENIDITCELGHVKSGQTFAGRVTKKAGNKHTLSFTPTLRGRHVLRVCVNSQTVRDFILLVAPDPASLRKPTHVISGLNEPWGVTTNNEDHIIVCEGNARIRIFGMDGTNILSFGSKGTGNGQFTEPIGVTKDGRGCIYITDPSNYRIQKFSPDRQFLTSAGAEGSGNLQFKGLDDVYYNRTTDMLYVTDTDNHRIQVLTSDLTFHSAFGRKGRGAGKLSYPAGVCCDEVGNVYVADSNNHCIQVFNAEGEFVRTIGSHSGPGKLKKPLGICIPVCSNLVYVTEGVGCCVSVFTLTGEFIGSFGKYGSNGGQFNYPTDVTITDNSVIIIVDHDNNNIQIF